MAQKDTTATRMKGQIDMNEAHAIGEALARLHHTCPKNGYMIAKGRIGKEPLYAINVFDRIDYNPDDAQHLLARGEGHDLPFLIYDAIAAIEASA